MSRLQKIKDKIADINLTKEKVKSWQEKGEKVVFTNGCFDILHTGHLSYLAEAASLGSRLVVAVNSDESVRTLGKDDNRPINAENDRAFLMAGLEIVDAVVIFNDSTPEKLISKLIPNVLVKGGDYDGTISDSNNPKYIVGREIVLQNSGEVKTIPTVQGYSTTNTIKKINS